ncbi:unnamed protein product [Heterobilharzia americana]|nr:unnamed protein product [Heterobilharzia americana]
MQRYFKLETYVGKLLMSYLNKYVKLRDDQFAMSIWDGDLTLTQLDLRLDFLEDIIPFPVNFRSGHVHELRIHVPWTKLNSECIVISLHTVECIFGLKKPNVKERDQNKQYPADFADLYSYKNHSMPTNVPPGYLEVYIHRLLSNIHFVVHNLNLKFIEEDIVLSVSVNKADCLVTDSKGNPFFADINPLSTYVIHRLIQFFDLTVCLDRAGPNGYVEVYEDPISYRFSMSCFVQIVCAPNTNSSLINQALLTNLKIHCQNFIAHISPAQIPLLCRLVQVLLNITTETFDWSILELCSDNCAKSETGGVEDINIKNSNLNYESDGVDYEKQSWASWVWSFVPSILTVTEDSDESENEFTDRDSEEKQLDTDSVKELIKCILEDAYEREVVVDLSTNDRNMNTTVNPVAEIQQTPQLYDPYAFQEFGNSTFQSNICKTSNEENSYLRRRKIRRLRRSVVLAPVFVIGIFIDKLDLDISLPCPEGFSCSSSNSGIRSRRVKRHFHHSVPAIKCEFTDIAFQTTLRDVYFRLVQLGIRGFQCYPFQHNRNSKCSLSNTCMVYDDNLSKNRPNFISLGYCRVDADSSISESFSHPREIFYSALSPQSSDQPSTCSKDNQKSSESYYSPILTLGDYSKYITDKDIRAHYPAIWFDSVYSLNLNESNVTPSDLPPVRQYQVSGVRESIQNRCLIGSYSVEVSPNLVHRLEGLINAYRNSHPYPPCSITVEDGISAFVPSDLSISRFSQHISTCNTRVDVNAGTIFVHASHSFSYVCLDHISLFCRSPIYPYDIVHIMTRQNIPAYLFKRSCEFIQMELGSPMKSVDDWLQDIHSGVQNLSSKEWNKQLIAYCYNRMIIKFAGICIDLISNSQVHHCLEDTQFTANDSMSSIFKLVNAECMLWTLSYPHLWNSPSVSHFEYRLMLADTMEMNVSVQTVGYLSCIISNLFYQLLHLKTYCNSQCKDLYLPPVHQYHLQNDFQSDGTKCWIWSTRLHGAAKFRLCFTKLVSVLQISLETNLLMYLNCLDEKKICPIMERMLDESSDHKGSSKPLFCLAVQIPYSLDASPATPSIFHAYLDKIDCLVTPELFNWFVYLRLPDMKHEIHSCQSFYENANITAECPTVVRTPDFMKRKCQLYNGSQSGSDISSKELVKANIIGSSFSTYSSVISPTYSLAIGNMAQWKEVWKRLSYCEKIFRNSKIQVLSKHIRIFTTINHCSSSLSADVESKNHQNLETLLTQYDNTFLLFGISQLYFSNYSCSEKVIKDGFSPTPLDDIVFSNCLWSCAVFELPMVSISENSYILPSNIHWTFSAGQIYLLMENTLVSAGHVLANLDFNHNQPLDSNTLDETHSRNPVTDGSNLMTINIIINVRLDHELSCLPSQTYKIPDFKVLSQTVNTIQFCYNGLFGIVIPKLLDFSTLICETSNRPLSRKHYTRDSPDHRCNTKCIPVCVNSPANTSSLNSISIIDESCVDISTMGHKTISNPTGKIKTSRSVVSSSYLPSNISGHPTKVKTSEIANSSSLKCQEIQFNIILQAKCTLICANGQIMLTRFIQEADEHPVLHWTLNDVQFTLDLQKECCSIDFQVGSFAVLIRKSSRSEIPLFTLLEKDIQPLQLLQPYLNATYDSDNRRYMSPEVQRQQSDKSCWLEKNYIPLIPLNARKRHRLNSNLSKPEDKSNIGQNFFRMVFTRTCSKYTTTSDYFSASQSDLSVLDNNSSKVYNMHHENNIQINVRPLDIVIIPEVMYEITSFINDCVNYKGSIIHSSFTLCNATKGIRSTLPFLTTHSMPIINATIDSFRLFYLLSGLTEHKENIRNPNALMLSCDFIQVQPLLENFIERPYFPNEVTLKQSFSSKVAVISDDRQIIVTANCINIVAVPFEFMCNVKNNADYSLSSSNAISQNPAKDWNRLATLSDVDDPLYGWSIVHSFHVSATFAPALMKYENSESYTYSGYSMELSLMNDLLILADCELISHLVQIVPSISSACNGEESSSQSSYPTLLERLFFSSDSDSLLSTPSRLFITARHIIFLMWKPIDSTLLAEFTCQINQPHIIMNIAGRNMNASNHLEFSINTLQVDCRQGALKSPCALCKPIVINKFMRRKCVREPVVIIIPCETDINVSSSVDGVNNVQHCSSSVFWHSSPSKTNSRTGITVPYLSITCIQPPRSECSSTLEDLTTKQSNRFKVCIVVGQDQSLCIRTSTVSAILHFFKFFHELLEVNCDCITDDDAFDAKNIPTSSVHQSSLLRSSSTAKLLHVLHRYINTINVDINPIRVGLRFQDATEEIIHSGILEFRVKQISTVIQLSPIHLESSTSTQFCLTLSSLSVVYFLSRGITESIGNTKEDYGRIDYDKPVYLLWPNASIVVGLSVNTKHCTHNPDIPSVYSFDKVGVHFQTDSGLRIHLPVCDYINDYIKVIVTTTINLVQSNQICKKLCLRPVHFKKDPNAVCLYCLTSDPLLYTDDLRRHFTYHNYTPVSTSSSPSSSQIISATHKEDDSSQHQFELSTSHPLWPWVLNQKLWRQSPLKAHPLPLPNEIVFYNNLSNDFDIAEEENRLHEPQWLGITWMSNGVCTPNYLRILPVPFEPFAPKLNNTHSPNGLELQCYLQYWEPLFQYNGSFVTYCSFIVSDSQVNQYDLSKFNSSAQRGSVPTSMFAHKGVSSSPTSRNVFVTENRPQTNLNEDIKMDEVSYSPSSVHVTKPVAAIWRILVDLRVRPGSNTANPSVNENQPVALARLTPMSLLGAIQLNSEHYPNGHPLDRSLIVRCQMLNVIFSLIEHKAMGVIVLGA